MDGIEVCTLPHASVAGAHSETWAGHTGNSRDRSPTEPSARPHCCTHCGDNQGALIRVSGSRHGQRAHKAPGPRRSQSRAGIFFPADVAVSSHLLEPPTSPMPHALVRSPSLFPPSSVVRCSPPPPPLLRRCAFRIRVAWSMPPPPPPAACSAPPLRSRLPLHTRAVEPAKHPNRASRPISRRKVRSRSRRVARPHSKSSINAWPVTFEECTATIKKASADILNVAWQNRVAPTGAWSVFSSS
jgi:hypothetical protein